MEVERQHNQHTHHYRRKAAVEVLSHIFAVANAAYVETIQGYGISEEDALKQISRFDEPTRRMMWTHIETVMCLDKDFAEEVQPLLSTIGQVLGMP